MVTLGLLLVCMQYTKERSKECIFSAVLLKCTSEFLYSEINKKNSSAIFQMRIICKKAKKKPEPRWQK